MASLLQVGIAFSIQFETMMVSVACASMRCGHAHPEPVGKVLIGLKACDVGFGFADDASAPRIAAVRSHQTVQPRHNAPDCSPDFSPALLETPNV